MMAMLTHLLGEEVPVIGISYSSEDRTGCKV